MKTERSAAVIASFKVLCQYVLNFLDAYLRRNKAALEFLRKAPSANGIATELVQVQMKLKDGLR